MFWKGDFQKRALIENYSVYSESPHHTWISDEHHYPIQAECCAKERHLAMGVSDFVGGIIVHKRGGGAPIHSS